MAGLSFAKANQWRHFAKIDLRKHGIRSISPIAFRGAKPSANRKEVFGKQISSHDEIAGVGDQANAILASDRFDTRRCDVMLVNFLGAKKVSIGTVCEIAWADAYRIPIVCMIEDEGNPHDHLLLMGMTGFRVNNFNAGIETVVTILGD